MKLFRHELAEADLHEIKYLFASYLAGKVVDAADKVYDRNGGLII